MKIGIAAAPADAPPSAFVVLRGDPSSLVDRAAEFGYDGLELALRDARQVDVPAVRARLAATGVEIPCISSGQVFATDGLYFTHPDQKVRHAAVERLIGFIHLAAEFGAKVNTGRVRGFVPEGESYDTALTRYLATIEECARVAEPLGVELIVEPVNRYELNFINNCEEGLEIVRRVGRRSVRLMPDLFHMNIEDASIEGSLRQARGSFTYVHVADSNRLAPGWGHLPLEHLVGVLADLGYDGYLTAEILPQPDPESAARQASVFLRGCFSRLANRLETAAAHI